MRSQPKPRTRRVQAVARIRLTIEVDASAWGGDCPLSQLYRQAADDALRDLEIKLPKARIVGEPEVTAIVVPEGGRS